MPVLTNSFRSIAGFSFGFSLLWAVPSAGQTVRFIDASPENVGLASPAEAGLPETIWEGTTPQRLAAALNGLPQQVSSPAQHRALVNILRLAAAPPPGDAMTPSLASLRVATLGRLGAEQDVMDLAEKVPQAIRHAPLWQAQSAVSLARYDLAGVCNLANRGSEAVPTADWQRLRGFCQLLRGQEEEAMVAVMLADEMGEDDAVFTTMFLGKQYANRASAAPISPTKLLHLAMLRALNLKMATPKWAEVSPTLAAGIARFPAVGLEVRTAAAERAVAGNTLPTDLLVQLYLATELSTPLGSVYQQMAYASNLPQRLQALEAFWDAAKKAGVYVQLAPYSLSYLSGSDMAGVPRSFAAKALRTALVAGDNTSIGTWQRVLLAGAGGADEAQIGDQSLAILAIAGQPALPVEQWWPAWTKAAKPSKSQIALVSGLLEAMGTPAPKVKGPKADRSATARALKDASLGEAALLALSALSGSPAPSTGLQIQAVEVLARLKPDHARAIAVELAVAAGI